MTKRRRYQILEIQLATFVELFKQGHEIEYKVVEGLPEDATIDCVEYDMRRNVVSMRVYSRKFEALPTGSFIPNTNVTMEKRYAYRTKNFADEPATA